MVFPYAPSYREPIYELMDKELTVNSVSVSKPT